MKKFQRYLVPHIEADLQKKMVFLAGPRQVGKTTLAKKVLSEAFTSFAYLNWDAGEDRKRILGQHWPEVDLLILDEFHKYTRWKTFVKGLYDKYHEHLHLLVTGSARLDTFRKGGDSLQGRYFFFRLHPFSVSEVQSHFPKLVPFEPLSFLKMPDPKPLLILLERGGFPEPFFMTSERERRRWRQLKLDRLFQGDVRDLTMVRELGQMAMLSQLLEKRVSGGLSLDNLARDLEVDYKTARNWVEILESLYYCYRLFPYQKKSFRSLKKQSKLYLWDWSEVEDPGARFENLVASHLLKMSHFLQDYEGYRAELWYLRDHQDHEVDFLVTVDQKPWFMVEAKLSDSGISNSLRYFKEKIGAPYAYQVVQDTITTYTKAGIKVLSASEFLTACP